MGVFACIVERGSFSGAARELGITTSAVSQQIRSLEQEMNTTLLHRSTRKISLTEAGQVFFQSCQEMMAAAERGKIRIVELQDHLIGELRIATTPELGSMHIIPALSRWMMAHTALTVHIQADNHYIDLAENRIDIAIRMSPKIEENDAFEFHPMARVQQVLVASPTYLNQYSNIDHPKDLIHHQLLPVMLMQDYSTLDLTHVKSNETLQIKMPIKIQTNNVLVMKSLCLNGHGIARILYLDAQHEICQHDLIEVLPCWQLPEYTLYAMTSKREHQPVKIQRCLDALKTYFSQLPGGR
ncbi:LysR family transcriptional regulator [Acinetobacter qingfengensis]